MPSDHLILCHSLLLLPSNFPSIRVFSNESVLRIRWPTCWDFSFNISPSSEYSGLISFTMDWFDLLAILRTLKSLLQHHNSKAFVLWSQLSFWSNSQNYNYWGNNCQQQLLTKWTSVCKVVSLLFDKLSWVVIAFLPNINYLWLRSCSQNPHTFLSPRR